MAQGALIIVFCTFLRALAELGSAALFALALALGPAALALALTALALFALALTALALTALALTALALTALALTALALVFPLLRIRIFFTIGVSMAKNVLLTKSVFVGLNLNFLILSFIFGTLAYLKNVYFKHKGN